MLDQIVLYPVADDELFAPGGRVVIRTYGFAKAAPGGDHPVAYRTWVTGCATSRTTGGGAITRRRAPVTAGCWNG